MSPDPKRVFLFANGPLPHPEAVQTILKTEEYLIAVDGGLGHMVDLGLTPDLVIGDLDSADPSLIQSLQDQDVVIRKHPAEKDQTDLELGIHFALDLQPEVIRILGALGGRIDQTLGNIFLLTKPELAEVDIRLVDGEQEVFLIRESAQIIGKSGQRVSLLPLHQPAEGVRTTGLKYQLDGETLYPDQTRGISNFMKAAFASIEVKQGMLLCIHEFSIETPERRG
jgi:thiamine pyrophosphokinase